jgi:hypothetical protein
MGLDFYTFFFSSALDNNQILKTFAKFFELQFIFRPKNRASSVISFYEYRPPPFSQLSTAFSSFQQPSPAFNSLLQLFSPSLSFFQLFPASSNFLKLFLAFQLFLDFSGFP